MTGFQRDRQYKERRERMNGSITLIKKIKSMIVNDEKKKIVIVGRESSILAIGDCAGLYESKRLDKFFLNEIQIIEETEKCIYLKIL